MQLAAKLKRIPSSIIFNNGHTIDDTLQTYPIPIAIHTLY